MRRIIGALSAIALTAALCSTAAAEPTQWADHRASVPAGQVRELGFEGTLAFRMLSAKGKFLLKAECEVSGRSTFLNEDEQGRGEVRAISFGECTEGADVQASTPWPTMLEASPTYYINELRGVALRVAGYGEFVGTMTPKIGDVDDVNNWQDDDDDHLVFGTARQVSILTDPVSGATLRVTGALTIEGRRIQAWRFPGPPAALLYATGTSALTPSPFGERESS